MAVVEVRGLTHRYGSVCALDDVDLAVPEGALYALLGPNGAGKTTLLRILAGLVRPGSGRVSVLGKELTEATIEDRAAIGYVAEGLPLPGWMTLRRLEAYLAPLYATWDHGLADELRRRFRLDADRRIRALSRGERMKAALLCTLAPRPRLLLMDEPFTGMDVVVKDDLVHGLLESAGREGWTVVIASHDLGELEALADRVGFIDGGRLLLSEPMEALRDRFKRVDVVLPDGAVPPPVERPAGWISVERAGPRVGILLRIAGDLAAVGEREGDAGAGGALARAAAADSATVEGATVEGVAAEGVAAEGATAEGVAAEGAAEVGGVPLSDELRRWFPDAKRIEVRPASLREIFVGLARRGEVGVRGAHGEAAEAVSGAAMGVANGGVDPSREVGA